MVAETDVEVFCSFRVWASSSKLPSRMASVILDAAIDIGAAPAINAATGEGRGYLTWSSRSGDTIILFLILISFIIFSWIEKFHFSRGRPLLLWYLRENVPNYVEN